MNHDWSVPLFETYWDEDDVSAVNKVIRRGNYWAVGPEIEQFELELSKFNQRRFAVVFNSGIVDFYVDGVHAVKLLIAWKVDAARKVVQCQDGKSYFFPAELGISEDPEIRLIFQ